ncbi:MAG: hypothetical protein U9N86_10045, partial [Bacteroidota bacterium]|nr:hypothetical protein [Bacteroidota bacterium]
MKKTGVTKFRLPYHLMGEIKSYHQSGKIKSIRRYNDNELISYKNLRESGEVDFGTTEGDVIAKYPGGSAVL